jgi:hypothetical protein
MDNARDKDAATTAEYERVFETYLGVCNQAIEKNKDKFPYMEIWRARWKSLEQGDLFQCAVYDERPKIIYTLRLIEDMKIKIIEKTHIVSKDVWPLTFSYLKHVTDHPQDYIDHPANLDWGWLMSISS